MPLAAKQTARPPDSACPCSLYEAQLQDPHVVGSAVHPSAKTYVMLQRFSTSTNTHLCTIYTLSLFRCCNANEQTEGCMTRSFSCWTSPGESILQAAGHTYTALGTLFAVRNVVSSIGSRVGCLSILRCRSGARCGRRGGNVLSADGRLGVAQELHELQMAKTRASGVWR